MQEWLSAKALSGLPGMPTSIRGIRVKARRSNWKSRETRGNGGVTLEFHVSALPQETQDYLRSIYKESDDDDFTERSDDVCLDHVLGGSSDMPVAVGDPEPVPEPAVTVEPEPTISESLSSAALAVRPASAVTPVKAKPSDKVDAWVKIFTARDEYCAQQQLSVVDGDYAFVKAYKNREIALPAEVYELVTKISRATIARKRGEIAKANGNVSALAGKARPGRPK